MPIMCVMCLTQVAELMYSYLNEQGPTMPPEAEPTAEEYQDQVNMSCAPRLLRGGVW